MPGPGASTGAGAPQPPQAAPAAPPFGPPPTTGLPPWAIVLIVAAVALPVLGVAGLASITLLGRSAEPRFEPVGASIQDDGAGRRGSPRDAFAPGPTSTPTTTAAADVDVDLTTLDCPPAAEVAAITGDGPHDDPVREATRFTWNDLDLPAGACHYGATTTVARISGDDPTATLAAVSRSSGRFQVTRANVGSDARWVILPGTPDEGSVSLVFAHDGATWVVGRNGQRHDEAIALHDLVVGR